VRDAHGASRTCQGYLVSVFFFFFFFFWPPCRRNETVPRNSGSGNDDFTCRSLDFRNRSTLAKLVCGVSWNRTARCARAEAARRHCKNIGVIALMSIFFCRDRLRPAVSPVSASVTRFPPPRDSTSRIHARTALRPVLRFRAPARKDGEDAIFFVVRAVEEQLIQRVEFLKNFRGSAGVRLDLRLRAAGSARAESA